MAKKVADKAVEANSVQVRVRAPNMQQAWFQIVGTAPYVQARFSAKAMQAMADKMLAGSTANKGKQRKARDFDEDYKQAMHISEQGWAGIPAASFRKALISACKLVDFKMTLAKLSLFVHADGVDRVDGVPLVKIKGTPERMDMVARNQTGVADIRVRPMWREWSAEIRVMYDGDQFTASDVANLLVRVGLQVGIGEGRADSRSSAGMGWGSFEVRG